MGCPSVALLLLPLEERDLVEIGTFQPSFGFKDFRQAAQLHLLTNGHPRQLPPVRWWGDANRAAASAPPSASRIFIVTKPPKSLGPPTVVLVQQTSGNPIDVPESLDKFGIFFLTFPGTFHPSCRHYRTLEI
jgi:hypothetical protein